MTPEQQQALAEMTCDWDLFYMPCEKCGDSTSGRSCHFVSDGGYEPRDGTYLCKKCFLELFGETP